MRFIKIIALSIVSTFCLAGPKVTYVGDGRYSCSGSRADCLPVERQNDLREQRRELDRLEQRQVEYQRDLLQEQKRQIELLEDIQRSQRTHSPY